MITNEKKNLIQTVNKIYSILLNFIFTLLCKWIKSHNEKQKNKKIMQWHDYKVMHKF